MKHIKEIDLDCDGNLDADDLGERVTDAMREASSYSNFANLIKVKMGKNVTKQGIQMWMEQLQEAFHRVGVTNCVIIPIFDDFEVKDITVDEVVTDLRDRVAFNNSKMHFSDEFICSRCGLILRENRRYEIDEDADGDESCYEFEIKYCPRCGRKIIEEPYNENISQSVPMGEDK